MAMRAMLRKDVCVMWKRAVSISVFLALFTAAAAWLSETALVYNAALLPVLALNLTLSSIAYDESCRWDRYAAMLPLPPWKTVVGKYVFSYAFLALAVVLGALGERLVYRATGKRGMDLGLMAALVLLAEATAVPLIYRLGARRGQTAVLLLWGGIAAVILGGAALGYADTMFGWLETIPVGHLIPAAAAVLALAQAVSILLSIRFYARRQRGRYD